MKQLLIIFFVTISGATIAQVNSPYSRFGIGTILPLEQTHLRSMGYLSSAYKDSIQTNLANPASLGGKIFSSLDLGFNTTYTSQKDLNSASNATTGNVTYLAYSFPINKKRTWGMALGTQPISSKEYKITAPTESNTYFRDFEGDGNNYKFYLQNGFNLTENFSIGLDAGIFFGTLNDKTYNNFLSGAANSFGSEVSQKLRGIELKVGSQYTIDLPKRTDLTIGATYQLENELNNEIKTTEFAYRIGQTDILDDGTIVVLDRTISYEDETIEKSKLTLPSTVSFGAYLSRHEKFSFGVDSKFGMWEDFQGINDDPSVQYRNTFDLSMGGSFIPNYRNANKSFERFEYRYGGHYSQSYLTINNTNIRDFGVSLGVGIPIRKNVPGSNILQIPSTIDFGIDIGQRGTLENDLVQESYIKGNIGLNLNDIWFQKRRYD